VNNHFRFLIHPQRQPNLKWLLEKAEVAVIREGAKIIQIDPWNRLEAAREPRETETDYIGRCLREIYNFAVDLDVHVQIVAHPSKTEHIRRGTVPELEDIAGSKHWDNMVDQGFVVHRPRLFDDEGNVDYDAELHYKKSRFDTLGHATKFGLRFDSDFGRFGTRILKKKNNNKVTNDQ
jgi:twinkle protein